MKSIARLLCLYSLLAISCTGQNYESIAGDPTATRIYTLDNGLKVYMSVNEDEPRIQTIITVRVGSQDDPKETTGLAHYFEHIMFKGTSQFGTSDYEKEKPLLDTIEVLFEKYRTITSEPERRAMYSRIDSVSSEAAKYAIPNEYDKLMALIGSSGSNAWTSEDCTSYIEQIPSNQLENWARIQADRFRDPVIRGFHTELESVYEEYNMYLTSPTDKIYERLYAMLYPNHPYGEHTIIGHQEHIKNPSITNIRKYFETYYVPNNMAICMSGDFDPDQAIKVIRKYFSVLKPNESLPERPTFTSPVRTEPSEDECCTEDGESICIAWNTTSASDDDAYIGEVVSRILSNGYCGIMDKELIQSQRVLSALSFHNAMASGGYFEMAAEPKEGQTLDEVRKLLLSVVAKLRNGDFDPNILSSTITNIRLEETRGIEGNFPRVIAMVESFVNGVSWEDRVHTIDRMAALQKEDIVEWASKYLTENGYCVVYKRQGKDTDSKKIAKPSITPLPTNSETESEYYTSVRNTKVEPISPSFVDYDKDMCILQTGDGNEILYRHNDTNDTFRIRYIYDLGLMDRPELDMASQYIDMLGTESYSVEQINDYMYAIACSYDFNPHETSTTVEIEGLAENTYQAVRMVDEIMHNSKGDPEILSELKKDMIQERENSLRSNRAICSALGRYCRYGKEAVARMTLSNARLQQMTDEELRKAILDFGNYRHTIMYYGPYGTDKVVEMFNIARTKSQNPQSLVRRTIPLVQTPVSTVTVVKYDAKQIRYTQSSVRDEDRFTPDGIASAMMFNEYFSSVVYQEMREARALAYSSGARYREGESPETPYTFSAMIGTQNDKMRDAIEAFDTIIEDMPESEIQFESARKAILSRIESSRTRKFDILTSFYHARQMGLSAEPNSLAYESIGNTSLEELKQFHMKHIAGRKYAYQIVGNTADIDMAYLGKLGKVEIIPVREIFGY